MAYMPYHAHMKMTMHINENTLAEVMKITGIDNKTRAVEVALTELARKHKLKTLLRAGLGATSEELKAAWEEPAFAEEEESMRVAESPAESPSPKSVTYSNVRRRSH